MEVVSWRKGHFYFQALFKKQSEIQYIKNKSFLLKVRNNIKTQNEQKLLRI